MDYMNEISKDIHEMNKSVSKIMDYMNEISRDIYEISKDIYVMNKSVSKITDALVPKDEWDEVKNYCKDDVRATEAILIEKLEKNSKMLEQTAEEASEHV